MGKKDADKAIVLFAGTSEEVNKFMREQVEEDKKKKRKAPTSETAGRANKKPKAKPLRLALPPTTNETTDCEAEHEDTTTVNTECTQTAIERPQSEEALVSPTVEQDSDAEQDDVTTDRHQQQEPVQEQPEPSPTVSADFDFSCISTPRAFRPSGIGSLTQLLSTVNVLVEQNKVLIKDNKRLVQCVERQSLLLTKQAADINDISKKVETLSARLASVNRMQPAIDTGSSQPASLDEVDSQYSLTESVVHEIKMESNNPGHFAANLVKRLFPELFGINNFKLNFNWYGGGKLGKQELCKERKSLVRQYVVRYYPEVRDEAAFKDVVVPKVKELLRRKIKDKENVVPPNQHTTTPDMSFTGLLNYIDM